MIDLERFDRRHIWAGLLAVVAAAALAGWFLTTRDDGESTQTEEEFSSKSLPLETWSVDKPRAVDVRLDEDGPELLIEDGEKLALTPAANDLDLDQWELHRTETHTYAVGQGRFGDASARAVWTFARGNPQAHFQMTLTDIPADRASRDLVFDLRFPGGDLETLSPLEVMPDGVATAARWTGGDRVLTVDNFGGEALATLPGESDATALGLILWSEDAGSGWEACDREDSATFDATMGLTITVGQHGAVGRWPQPSGQQGRIVPVFGDPREHHDVELHQGATDDPEKWVARARALAHGHSKRDEPRFGNGGLLGNDLGGSIIVPSDLADEEVVHRFAESLEGSRVELLADPDSELPQAGARLVDEPSCEDLVEAASGPTGAVLLEADESAGAGFTTPPLSQHGDLAPLVSPRGLDGSIEALVDEGFGQAERVADEHTTLIFETPFVATRNPLIGAAKEALLHPERHGQWTLSSPLSDTFADIEIWREEMPVEVTSLSAATRHLQDVRHTVWGWSDGGDLIVYHPGDVPIANYTLALPGKVQGRLDNEPVHTRSVASDDGEKTLLWFDLKPGANHLELSGVEREAKHLPGVEWRIE